jgi:hypothetical protein
VEKESDVAEDEVAVVFVNPEKKHPTVNIKFPQKPERKERTENQRGKKVTKSWVDSPNVIASIDTQEGYVHFNRSRIKHSELRDLLDVADAVCGLEASLWRHCNHGERKVKAV